LQHRDQPDGDRLTEIANTWIRLFAAALDNVIRQWLFNGLVVAIVAIVVVACGGLCVFKRELSWTQSDP
jgi:hypothetical protein